MLQEQHLLRYNCQTNFSLDFSYKVVFACEGTHFCHYNDLTMTMMAPQITSLTVVYSIVDAGADQRKHQSSASLAFVRGIHRDWWFPAQRASNAENVSIWWRHQAYPGTRGHCILIIDTASGNTIMPTSVYHVRSLSQSCPRTRGGCLADDKSKGAVQNENILIVTDSPLIIIPRDHNLWQLIICFRSWHGVKTGLTHLPPVPQICVS